MSSQSNNAESSARASRWEVFVQEELGEPHIHAGSVQANDAKLALLNARDVYSRRGSVKSIWVAPAQSITASSPEDAGAFFEPSNDKMFRYPQFYKSPQGVKNL